jgi:subtilisin family serine protease
MTIRGAVVLLCGLVLALPTLAGGLAPKLEEALLSAGPDDRLPVVVMMEAKAVDGALLARVGSMNRKDRREHVVARLRAVATESQTPVRDYLATLPGDPPKVRTLLGVNGLALDADPQTIRKLADLPGVRWILLDQGGGHPDATDAARNAGLRGWSDDAHQTDGDGPTGGDTSGPNPDATVRPELIAMGAQDVWNLGYTGAGVIVAIVDTGVDRTHPDLADHIWTNLDEVPDNGIDDDANGYIDDTWGWELCDDNNDPSQGSHGTQVAGQVAGDGTNGTVTGMAPDVELMALGIDCDTPSIGWAASDYAIMEGAHIISQSYSWWWTDQPDYEAFRRQTDAQLAAGVIHANSAGNHGHSATYPVPYNISTPANCPAPWRHPEQNPAGGVSGMIGVGNIDWFSDTIEFSSSRGPSAWEDIQTNTDPLYPHTIPPEYQDYPFENGAQPGLIKPDISAYGNATESTCPGGIYCSFSGTSSAQPKVAGTLALMLQASPEATPARLAEALLTTAEPRGDPGMDNEYGVGLVQALPAVELVQSEVLYHSHAIDDIDGGNGDLALDPGETATMRITVHNVTEDTAIDGVEGVLTTTTPGVEIHNRIGFYPTVSALGTAESFEPHYSLTLDPGTCASNITFDLELRFNGEVHLSTFNVRVGDVGPVLFFNHDFETAQGWTPDPGTATHGFWVREDPDPSRDASQRYANPGDDSSPDPGTHCWVTGNGGSLFDITANDVDGGTATLTSPPFGSPNLITLDLKYDGWYYGRSSPPGDSVRVELSNDGGASWTLVHERTESNGQWYTFNFDLMPLLSPTDDMRLRVSATDAEPDGVVEAAIDEVSVSGLLAECDDYTPSAAQPPNPVGDTLVLGKDAGGHVVLEWDAPPVDAGHDPATLYRVDRDSSPTGSFVEAGSATATIWLDVDELTSAGNSYYLVRAENSGGSE